MSGLGLRVGDAREAVPAPEVDRAANLGPDEAEAPLRIVAIGGGTGLPVVLRGLRLGGLLARAGRRIDVTAVVTVADDGGSSGRLRRELGMPPPGDIRNCLVAMAAGSSLSPVFQYRFEGRRDLGGHTVGNLVLAALSAMHGDFLHAVRVCAELLNVVGQVLPSTLSPVTLRAERADGSVVRGESQFGVGGARLRRVWLEPPGVPATPGVEEALRAADLVVLGPGSLFSSLLPNLLIEGIARGLTECRGVRVLVLNAMTQRGETIGMSAADHVRAVQEAAGPRAVDVVLVNTAPLPKRLRRSYDRECAAPVHYLRRELLDLGVAPIETHLAAFRGRRVRHDAIKVGDVLHCLVGRALGHA